MSKLLVEKIRKAREQNITINGHTYTIRRPTDGELANMPDSRTLDFVQRFVVGWDFKEVDLIPGGGPETVPFDLLLWAEYVNDHSEIWEALVSPMLESYRKHKEQTEVATKN
jgi:hypothetical protein